MPNLALRALKFCWISVAESALLYADTCDMFPFNGVVPATPPPIKVGLPVPDQSLPDEDAVE